MLIQPGNKIHSVLCTMLVLLCWIVLKNENLAQGDLGFCNYSLQEHFWDFQSQSPHCFHAALKLFTPVSSLHVTVSFLQFFSTFTFIFRVRISVKDCCGGGEGEGTKLFAQSNLITPLFFVLLLMSLILLYCMYSL